MARFAPGRSGNPGGRPKSALLNEPARSQAEPHSPLSDPDSKNTIVLVENGATGKERQKADHALSGIVANANTARAFGKVPFGELDLTSAVDVLRERANCVVSGNLSGAETTLVAQATALDSIFNAFALRALVTIDRQLHTGETFLRLALKAQSQCRTTLLALAEIKNPPTVFARQANIANGPQQVNNEAPAPASCARENEIAQNKLLEQEHGKRMDARTTSTTGKTDISLDTLAAIHGTEDQGW